jgi:hypothetical protein
VVLVVPSGITATIFPRLLLIIYDIDHSDYGYLAL